MKSFSDERIIYKKKTEENSQKRIRQTPNWLFHMAEILQRWWHQRRCKHYKVAIKVLKMVHNRANDIETDFCGH